MNDFERQDFHRTDLRTLTLRRVMELALWHRIELVLVCRTPDCRRRSKVDMINRISRYGEDFALGDLCARSCCVNCKNRDPAIYFVIESPRRFEDQWFPRPPP